MKPLLLLTVLFSLTANAETFTTTAPTYPVQEKDFIEMILSKLKGMEESGKLAELQKQYQEQVKAEIIYPKALDGFSPVTKAATRYFDPSIVLTKDIADHQGRLIAMAGQRINPLDHTGLTKKLAFIDGTDSKQLDWARQLLAEQPTAKIILVAGSYFNLSKEFRRPIFFDQGKKITQRFGITKVPSLIQQADKRIKIDEIYLPR